MIGIATAARTAGVAVLAGAAALGLALGTAEAARGMPGPPSGEGTLYGDPAAAAPFWRYQQYDDDCVPMAVADVVGELTGHQPSERAIIKVAQSTPSTVRPGPIYTKPKQRKPGSGTSFEDEPALLAHYGIHAVDTDKESTAKSGVPTGMKALEQDLAKGRKVIAAVNSELIWREPVEDKTSDGEPESNHAVVVTGIDTAAGIVHLNDSGSEDGRDEQVPIDIFVRSWNSSDDEMTVTS
jgi:Peptidase_C39 like family